MISLQRLFAHGGVAVALAGCALRTPAQSAVAEVSERPAVAVVLRRDDGSTRTLRDTVALSYLPQRTRANLVPALLRANGIEPDAEALGLVYELNADFDPADTSREVDLVVPRVGGPREVTLALNEGYRAALTVESELKRSLLTEVANIGRNATTLTRLPESAFSSADYRERFVGSVNYTAQSMQLAATVIRERGRPLNVRAVRQMKTEAVWVNRIFSRSERPQFNANDLRLVENVANNMRLRMASFDERRGPNDPQPRWREAPLQVWAVRASGDTVYGKRVYFVDDALYVPGQEAAVDVEKIPQLTSPSRVKLPEANYMIWIGEPGNPEPISEVFPLRLRRDSAGAPFVLPLVVLRPR
jgi:hypothetical protein